MSEKRADTHLLIGLIGSISRSWIEMTWYDSLLIDSIDESMKQIIKGVMVMKTIILFLRLRMVQFFQSRTFICMIKVISDDSSSKKSDFFYSPNFLGCF